MQRLINEIVERAKADRQRIVLPEGTEETHLESRQSNFDRRSADLILLGNRMRVILVQQNGDLETSAGTIIDPRIIRRKEPKAIAANYVKKKA